MSIFGRFCVRVGISVEIEKCISSKIEREIKIVELMIIVSLIKLNINSSMYLGFMALCWYGEIFELGGLYEG